MTGSNPFLAGIDPVVVQGHSHWDKAVAVHVEQGTLTAEAVADIGANGDDVEDEARRSKRRDLTITKLNDDDGYWTARLTISGSTTEVDKKFGSWRVTPENDAASYKELLPQFCMALQDKVVPIETARRKAIEDSKKPVKVAASAETKKVPDLMAALEESLKPKAAPSAGVTLG